MARMLDRVGMVVCRWGELQTTELERETREWFVLGVEKDERTHVTAASLMWDASTAALASGYTLHLYAPVLHPRLS